MGKRPSDIDPPASRSCHRAQRTLLTTELTLPVCSGPNSDGLIELNRIEPLTNVRKLSDDKCDKSRRKYERRSELSISLQTSSCLPLVIIRSDIGKDSDKLTDGQRLKGMQCDGIAMTSELILTIEQQFRAY